MTPFDAPPPFLRIRNWLGPERVAWLLDYAYERRSLFRPSTVHAPEGSRIERATRISQRIFPVPEIAADMKSRIGEVLPDIFRSLGAAPFHPGSYEIDLVAHGDGAFYDMHCDTGPGKPDVRRVSGVYYFHREPKRFSGGPLRLYSFNGSKNPGTFADIEPENDSVVFFPSWFPHEVLPVSCTSEDFMDCRFAINCWVCRERAYNRPKPGRDPCRR